MIYYILFPIVLANTVCQGFHTHLSQAIVFLPEWCRKGNTRSEFSGANAAGPSYFPHDAEEMATRLGNVKAQNIVLLGTLVKGMKLDGIDWKSVLGELIPPRMYDLNVEAFKAGFERVRQENSNVMDGRKR